MGQAATGRDKRMATGEQRAERARLLLGTARGVTFRYARAALAFGLVEDEELRVCGVGRTKRVYLA